ncbi:MAG: ATP-binding protein [Eubacteriales bacterium]
MSYPRKNVEEVTEDYSKKRKLHEAESRLRLEKVYSEIPEIKKIDDELRKTGSDVIHAVLGGNDDIDQKISEIKKENLALQKKRADILVSKGYSPDYTSVKYDCEKCRDTGYDGVYMCECFRKALVMKGFESSGISNLLKEQNFESFSLDYYKDDEKAYMEDNFRDLYDFAHNFENDKRSFLLMGATGLGKTHLSTSVAKVVIEKGYDVVYETAQNIFSDFASDRFRNSYSDSEPVSDKYLNCDLLIMDDLGTEMISQFSVSCLYNIINTRLNKNLPIIASTNLSSEELRKVYQDRITSRLFGNFYIKLFVGKDVRQQKI